MRILLVSAFCLMAVVARANEKGNGGDICEDRFKVVRDDIKAWISSGNAKSLSLPQGISLSLYTNGMLDAISDAMIECTSDKVMVGTTEKTCKNFVANGKSRIQCNSGRFTQTLDEDQYVLVHHEFAGLGGIEKMDEESSDYSVSNQISGYLVDQLIKKLNVVPPPGTPIVSPAPDKRVPYADAGMKTKFLDRTYSYQGQSYSISPINGGLRVHLNGQPNDVVIAPPAGSPPNVMLEPYVVSANSKIIILGDDKMKKLYVFDTQLMRFIYSEDYPPVDLDFINYRSLVYENLDTKEPPSVRRLYFGSSHMRVSASGNYLIYSADFQNWRLINLVTMSVQAVTLAPMNPYNGFARIPLYLDDKDGSAILLGGETLWTGGSILIHRKGPEFIPNGIWERWEMILESSVAIGQNLPGSITFEYPNGNIVVAEKDLFDQLMGYYAYRAYLAADDKTIKIRGNTIHISHAMGWDRIEAGKPTVFYADLPIGYYGPSVGGDLTRGIIVVVFDVNTDIDDPPTPIIYKRKVVVIDLLTNLVSEQLITSPQEYFRCDETSVGTSRGINCNPCTPQPPPGIYACGYYYEKPVNQRN